VDLDLQIDPSSAVGMAGVFRAPHDGAATGGR